MENKEHASRERPEINNGVHVEQRRKTKENIDCNEEHAVSVFRNS